MNPMRFRRPTAIPAAVPAIVPAAVARLFRGGERLSARQFSTPQLYASQLHAPQRTPGLKTRATAIVAARWIRIGLACACLAAAGNASVARCAQTASQRKTPAKSPATSSSQQAKDDPLAPLLQQANDAIDKMDFAAALDPLQKYIAQRPDEPYPHFQLGYAYVGLKRPADAKVEFSRAIALDPKMAAAYLNLGLVLMDSDPAAAAEAFRRAAELQPTESRPRFLAGFSL